MDRYDFRSINISFFPYWSPSWLLLDIRQHGCPVYRVRKYRNLHSFIDMGSFIFLGKYADSGSMVGYPSIIDDLFPIKERSPLYKLVYRVRPLIQREYFAFIILLASVFGGYALVLGITSLSLVLIAIHLFDDFLMTKRLETYDRHVLNKA